MLASSRATYGKFSGKKQQKQPKLASSRTTCGKFHGKNQQKQPKLASSRATYGKVSGTLLGNELMIGQKG
jgi:cytochrome c553